MKKISSASIWLVVFVLVIFASLALLETNKNVSTISVDKFQEHWVKKEIKSVQVREDKTVAGELSDGTQYETIIPLQRLLQVMDKYPNHKCKRNIYKTSYYANVVTNSTNIAYNFNVSSILVYVYAAIARWRRWW